jgi:RNA polymerase sigma factor
MNKKAVAAKNDLRLRENFIRDSEQTILRIASRACNKFITRSDDEWSVALYAFNKAIDSYSEDAGDFVPYSSVVIKRALIDYYRNEKRHANEMPVSDEMLTGEGDYSSNSELLGALYRDSSEVSEKTDRTADLRSEILDVNERLKKYGFTFRDLKGCSPKAGKTKRECAKAITYILDNKEVLASVLEVGRMPAKEIEKQLKISLKLLDRYRRYIIMAVVILNGEYPLLADYLQYIRKDAKGS